jgi:predicted ATPase/TolB-like protein/Tfp pilus assembly protein PilF
MLEGDPSSIAESSNHTTRRLAAIWFTDIVGYTGLASRDENAALALVRHFQQLAREIVGEHRGRLVKFLGDAAMAEFVSTDAAVRSAVELVVKFHERSDSLGTAAQARAAVHVGDLVAGGDGDIYGDGVNIAQRLQLEAAPSQVVVSEDVWHILRQRKEFRFDPIGERALRGVDSPVEVYAVNLGDSAPKPVAAGSERSIAVLPFRDIGTDPSATHFAEGMTEELSLALSHIEGLRVAARTSSGVVRDKAGSIKEIGSALNVGAILEGSVRAAGDRLRISAQLVDVPSGYQLWSGSYERRVEDVFSVQDEIAAAIVVALEGQLSAPGEERSSARRTSDPRAYSLYLEGAHKNLYIAGRYHWGRHSGEDLWRSVECFEQAVAIDPDYAQAYAGLADAWLTLGALLHPPKEAYPRARAAAQRALEIDERLAEAHASLAEVRLRYDWDFEAAEKEYRRALSLNPRYGEGLRMYANFLRDMGRLEEAIVVIRRAQVLDPDSLPIGVALAGILYFARRYDEAIEECKGMLEKNPEFFHPMLYLGMCYERKKMHDEAIDVFTRLVEQSHIPGSIATLGYAHARAGRRPEAKGVLRTLEEIAASHYVPAYLIGSVLAPLGELDAAFQWFDRAVEERSNWLISMAAEPRFDDIRSDSRFVDLLRRIGFRTSIGDVPNNLPVQPTPLVGRTEETHAIRELIVEKGGRIVTLTGPPGTGKTRLGLRAAETLLGEFPDGVFLVPLAAIREPRQLVPEVARVVGVEESSAKPIGEILKRHLHGLRALILLDGIEHLRGAVPELAELLAGMLHSVFLVTSRAPLRIRGEHEFPVPPLDLPGPSAANDPDEAFESDAVRLFVQRAQAVQPAFSLTAQNAGTVVEICRRLDGLPLAIELAAARIKHMTAREVLARLEDRLGFLVHGPRDLPGGHRTLLEAFAGTQELLDDPEKRLFRRLAVFIGGWDLEAAERVCAETQDDVLRVLDGLAALVDLSLVHQTETPEEGTRFGMLETVHEYAAHLLAEVGEDEDLRHRHAEYYRSLALGAEPHLQGERLLDWLERLERDRANLYAALDWLLDQDAIEEATRMGNALWRFWWIRGHFSEMRHRLEQALAVADSRLLPRSVQANLRVAMGALALEDGDQSRAVKLFEEAVALERGRTERSGVGIALRALGFGLSARGDYDRAAGLFEEALTIDRELGDDPGSAAALRGLAKMETYRGNVDRAAKLFEEALAIDRGVHDEQSEAFSLLGLGEVARLRGELDPATQRYEEALAVNRRIGSKPGIAYVLYELAETARARGQKERAHELYAQTLALLVQLGNRRRIVRCLVGLAALSVQEGDAERAARLLGFVDAQRERMGVRIPPTERDERDRLEQTLRSQLSPALLQASVDAGRAMTWLQGISIAPEPDPAGAGARP